MQRNIAFMICLVIPLGAKLLFGQSSYDRVYDGEGDRKDYRSDRFEIASANKRYRLGIRGHLQQHNQFIYNKVDKTADLKIELNRARLSLYGSAFDPSLTFLFQAGFEGLERGGDGQIGNNYPAPGTNYLRDYYFNLAANENYFHLRVGKFRMPFSRQQLMSTAQMQFYDQSLANNTFQPTTTGRDIGIMFHNGFNKPFEWALAAVTNGLVARLGFNYNQIDGYDAVDWSKGDFRFGVAANAFIKTDYKRMSDEDIRAGADFIIKGGGFSTNGAFYCQRTRSEGAKANHILGAGLDLGYLFDQDFEPVLRGSWINRDKQHGFEVLGGVNYYFFGHHLKTQIYGGGQFSTKEFNRALGGVQLQFAI